MRQHFDSHNTENCWDRICIIDHRRKSFSRNLKDNSFCGIVNETSFRAHGTDLTYVENSRMSTNIAPPHHSTMRCTKCTAMHHRRRHRTPALPQQTHSPYLDEPRVQKVVSGVDTLALLLAMSYAEYLHTHTGIDTMAGKSKFRHVQDSTTTITRAIFKQTDKASSAVVQVRGPHSALLQSYIRNLAGSKLTSTYGTHSTR
jgi:hypothetical protein